MLISPTFLYTMSDFSRFAALIVSYRLQSAHFHLLISKDAFAIIAPQILLAHPFDPIVTLFFTPKRRDFFVILSTDHSPYSSVPRRKASEQYLRHEYFLCFLSSICSTSHLSYI